MIAHSLPSHRTITFAVPAGPDHPTAHASVLETADIPNSFMLSGVTFSWLSAPRVWPAPAIGAVLHCVPSQCSIVGLNMLSPLVDHPAAHMSSADTTLMACRLLRNEPGFGLATWDHSE